MGIDIESEIKKTSLRLTSYGIPEQEQVVIIKRLLDCGIEKCLQEQEKIRDKQNELLAKAYVGPGLVH